MKGIAVKDWILGRKQMAIGSVIFIMFQGLAYLVRYSFIYGNPADNPELIGSVYAIDAIFIICPWVLINGFITFAVNVPIYADYKCSFNKYLISAGLNEMDIIKPKVAETAAAWCLSFLMGLIGSLIYNKVFSSQYFKAETFIAIFICLLIFIAQFIALPISFKYKTASSVSTKMLLFIGIPLYLVLSGLLVQAAKTMEVFEIFMKISNFVENIKKYYLQIILVSIAAVVLAGVCSCLICLKILRKRDNIC